MLYKIKPLEWSGDSISISAANGLCEIATSLDGNYYTWYCDVGGYDRFGNVTNLSDAMEKCEAVFVEELKKYLLEIDVNSNLVYRVWDKVGSGYIKSRTGIRVFMNKIWAQKFCDKANEFAPDCYEIHTFEMNRVFPSPKEKE